jgi:hypothetical protein
MHQSLHSRLGNGNVPFAEHCDREKEQFLCAVLRRKDSHSIMLHSSICFFYIFTNQSTTLDKTRIMACALLKKLIGAENGLKRTELCDYYSMHRHLTQQLGRYMKI